MYHVTGTSLIILHTYEFTLCSTTLLDTDTIISQVTEEETEALKA